MNEELKKEILKNFKLYNSIEDIKVEEDTNPDNSIEGDTSNSTNNNQDELYNLYIDKAVQSILNLTNRIRFPEPLKYVVLDMMNDFYKEYLRKDSSNDSNNNYIKQIEEEGRKVVFGSMTELEYNSIVSSDIANKLELRRKEIYRYRLLYKEVDNGKN